MIRCDNLMDRSESMLKNFCFLFIFLSTQVLASGPKDVVKSIFNEAKNPEIAKDKKLQENLNQQISFDDMATNSLGKYKKELTAEQYSWYSKTLKEIITETVYPEAPDFFKGVKVTYEDESVKKDKAQILSVVTEKGEETEVEYTLRKVGEKWLVIDVSLDDESWIESIYEEVDVVMKKDKWDGLKAKLTKRLNEIRTDDKSKSQKSKKS